MKKLLCAALFSLLACSACVQDAPPTTGRKPDREYNSVNGNYERQPPFGPRSNKASE